MNSLLTWIWLVTAIFIRLCKIVDSQMLTCRYLGISVILLSLLKVLEGLSSHSMSRDCASHPHTSWCECWWLTCVIASIDVIERQSHPLVFSVMPMHPRTPTWLSWIVSMLSNDATSFDMITVVVTVVHDNNFFYFPEIPTKSELSTLSTLFRQIGLIGFLFRKLELS